MGDSVQIYPRFSGFGCYFLGVSIFTTSRTGGSVGEHRAVTWEVVSSTPTGPTLRVLK